MDAIFRRLSYYAEVGDVELKAISELRGRKESYKAGEDIITRGDEPVEAFFMLSGWAMRYVALPDGRSQVLNFMLPGDVFDLQVFGADGSDHSISALNAVDTFHVPRREILKLFEAPTRAGAALWWCTLQEEAILREQIVRIGRRTARERLAHLILELHRRAVIAGEGVGAVFNLPVSQVVLADALGLSFVHVSRVITELHRAGCIERERKALRLLDRAKLVEIAGFTDDYLHLDANPFRLGFGGPIPAG